MTLFWQHGYEAISLADLVGTTNAEAPILYMEFTNKERLFRTVLDRYITRSVAKHKAQLSCGEKNLESTLENYFTVIMTCFTSKGAPTGCFVINTSATLTVSSRDIAHTVKSRRAVQEQTLIQFLRQHQQRGEIPAHCDVQKLAEYLNCILRGMSISIREGVAFEKLMQIARTTLRL